MCTVVCEWHAGSPVRILALRDEFVGRAFDDPGEWWPDQPGVIGGRDRSAGGSWCVSDIASGTTALLLNRIERREGTPSRGLLPLAALADGDRWPERVDPTTMASFNLVLARPTGVTVWIWDAVALRRLELGEGTHLITSRGVDAADAKTIRFAPQFETAPWREVVTACEPSAEESALVIRHEIELGVYATVFGQLISAVPGALEIAHSRTPWIGSTWTEQRWNA